MRAVVGMGSNVGDRLATMREAAEQLGQAPIIARILARSRVWETAPVGGPAQGPFLNAAVLVDLAGSLPELLLELERIMTALGRARGERWGPRPIDLDILWASHERVDTPSLVVPHARLRERAFAVVPLLDVVPDAVDPQSGKAYAALGHCLAAPIDAL